MPSICLEARKMLPTLPTKEISLLLDFRETPPKIEAFRLQNLASRFPEFSLPDVNSRNKKIACYSLHAQGVTWYMMCEGMEVPMMYDLLEALLRHQPGSIELQKVLNVVETISQKYHEMEAMVHSDFLLFLTDEGCPHWSSVDAKELIRNYPNVRSCLFPSTFG